LIKDLKLYKTGNNPGGLNLFSVPNWTWSQSRSWLIESANRGDLIRLISDPTEPRTIWKNGIPPGQPGHNGIKTVTGREIEVLENELGYVWNPEIAAYAPQ
jgi:hypothetical protein